MIPSLTRREAMVALIGGAIASRASAHDGVIHGEIHEVEIKSFAFMPAELTVKVGDGIRWTNADLSPHTATAEDGSWDTGAIAQGESKTLEVLPGMATQYHCLFHPNMLGTLVIAA